MLSIATLAAASPAWAQLSSIRITEVMSSSGVGGTEDWLELTNYSGSTVDISGWKVDDNSFLFSAALALTGVTSLGPGESAIFFEGGKTTTVANFQSFWGLSGVLPQIGSYTGSGIGFSSTGDGAVIFNASGIEVTPRVTFGAATAGTTFYYAYDSAGLPTTSPNTNALVSSLGTLDGQISYASTGLVSSVSNIGSPGTAINAVPEPSSIALCLIGGSAAAFGISRRRAAVRRRQTV